MLIETAIGKNATYTVGGRERYPVRVRYARDLGNLWLASKRAGACSNGVPIPLGEVAQIGGRPGGAM